MNKNELIAQLAAVLNTTEDVAPKADAPVVISHIQVAKATESGERWVTGFCAEHNCNVRLNQAAVDALQAADYVRPGEAKVVSPKLTTLPLRGAVVIGTIGAVRTSEDGLRRDAVLTRFDEVRSTAVKVTKWDF
jgi:hypothetical protein